MTGIDARTHAPVRVAATAAAPSNSHNSTSFGGGRGALRDAVVAELADFVSRHCAEALGDSGVDIATDVLMGFLQREMPAIDVRLPGLAVRSRR